MEEEDYHIKILLNKFLIIKLKMIQEIELYEYQIEKIDIVLKKYTKIEKNNNNIDNNIKLVKNNYYFDLIKLFCKICIVLLFMCYLMNKIFILI